jgi:hypothetical protein
MDSSMKAEIAILRFHLRVGARLAARILAPVLAVIFIIFYILRPEFVIALARGLFVEGSLAESGLVGTLLLLGLARAVAPRITAGKAGWARSLPADGRVLRAMEVLSSVVAEMPLLAVLGALAWFVAGPSPERIALRLAGLLVGAAAAGFLCLSGSSSIKGKILPAAACFISFSGNGMLLGGAAALLAVAMAVPIDPLGRRRRRRSRRRLPSALFFYGLSLRAVGARIVLAFVPPAAILAACRLFLANNELAAKAAFSLSLCGLVLAPAVFIGLAANIMAVRRPAWPWLRSLPRSAGARIASDALFLGLNALPLMLGLALLGRPAWEAAFLAGPLAWFAFRGAGAIREAADRRFGALGPVFVEGAIISMSVAVLPWLSGLLAAAAPIAFHLARNAERRFKPTLWAERHHLDAGDPLSWSAS